MRKKTVIRSSIISSVLILSFAVSPAMADTKSTSKGVNSTQTNDSSNSTIVAISPDTIYTASDLGINVKTPPSNFNPLVATDQQLEDYGFPSRPTDPNELTLWKGVMGDYKRSVVPKFKLKPSHTLPILASRSIGGLSGSLYTGNWSGYMKNAEYYNAIHGNWNVPDVSSYGQPGQYAYSCSWVGLGGYYTDNLMQAGTEQNYYHYAANSARDYGTYYFWWEVLPANQTEITNVAINPGDNVYVSVSYTSGTFYWYVEDRTTGDTVTGSKAYSSSYFDSDTAEWITERPKVNNSFPNLADFYQEHYSYDEARTTSGTWEYLTGSDIPMRMTSNTESTGTLLAHPGSVGSNGSFTDYWDNFE